MNVMLATDNLNDNCGNDCYDDDDSDDYHSDDDDNDAY